MASESTVIPNMPAVNPKDDHFFTPETQVMLLTWLSFFIVLAVLSKFVWKPILAALDQREENIRKAVEEAEKIRAEYQQIEEKRLRILRDADHAARELSQQSRKAALQSAKVLEDKAKENAKIAMENARREIEAQEEKSSVYLREKSADTAVALATKILKEKLDTKTQTELIDNLINEI